MVTVKIHTLVPLGPTSPIVPFGPIGPWCVRRGRTRSVERTDHVILKPLVAACILTRTPLGPRSPLGPRLPFTPLIPTGPFCVGGGGGGREGGGIVNLIKM